MTDILGTAWVSHTHGSILCWMYAAYFYQVIYLFRGKSSLARAVASPAVPVHLTTMPRSWAYLSKVLFPVSVSLALVNLLTFGLNPVHSIILVIILGKTYLQICINNINKLQI